MLIKLTYHLTTIYNYTNNLIENNMTIPPRAVPKPGPRPTSISVASKTNLKKVDDLMLEKTLSDLIEANQSQLSGEYDLYTIYRKDDKENYALIYAFYLEEDGITYDSMDEISQKDAKFIHSKIAGLNLDYLFVVPYYDYQDREKGSVMTGAVITNEF